jgi:Zn-dependent metalloprotease
MSTGKQGTLKLVDVESQIAVTAKDTMNWQAQLRAAVANSISEEDVVAIIQKQVEKAKAGNEAAAKFVLNHVLGTNTPINIRQTNIITDPETAARLARDAG